ncbi:MAG: EVE domain-containing protein [Chloroflexi bacterium]|nr:EVE domain-containing protein [Chloroflexota bacterium]
MAERRYWLFKSEPSNYSFDDLLSETDQTAEWDGVRNYQARNLIRDDMKVGDGILFYHSSTDPTAVVGTATIAREAYPDSTAWDPQGKYYDPKSSPDNPTWMMVDIKAGEKFARPVTLQEIKLNPKLEGMMLVRRGMRLSIQTLTEEEWDEIVALGRQA